MRDGLRQWIGYGEPVAHTDDFPALGEAFESISDNTRRSKAIRVMSQRRLVDFGASWLAAHRRSDGSVRDENA
jgi:hypothetical protein